MDGLPFERYALALQDYLKTQREAALYEASLLSQLFVEQRAGPDEIVALHFESLDSLLRGLSYREHTRAVTDAHQFLLEVMIAYGVTYREYVDLKTREHEIIVTAREEILGAIAHELRTPITVAQVSLDLATRHIAKGQMDLVPSRIVTAHGALERLSRLTANLVRSDSTQPFPDPHEVVDLVVVSRQACEWAKSAAEDKGHALVHDLDALKPCLVYGDSDALLSVWGNLLSNAIRYTPTGGTVTIRQGIDGACAWLEVEDNGVGMPDDVKARIFDKFYRSPEARLIESQGLGLGLTLVHQAVTGHRGTVSVQSIVGQGTIFRVTLPMATITAGSPNQKESVYD